MALLVARAFAYFLTTTKDHSLVGPQGNLKYWGGTYLHMFKVLDVFALCFYDFPDDIIACGFLCVCRSWYFR